MTSNELKGDREKCLECGMNDYVSKPVKTQDLASMIRKWRDVNQAQSKTKAG